MTLLFGLSIVFMLIAYVVRRPWTIGLPFAAWLGLWLLGRTGTLSDATSLESALLAGIVGAGFAAAGLFLANQAARRMPPG
jgi:hypothetical protein